MLQDRLQSLRLETIETEVEYLTRNIQNLRISRSREGLSLGDYKLELESIYLAEDTIIGYIRRKYVLEPDLLLIQLSYRKEMLIKMESVAVTIDNKGDIISLLAGIALDRTANVQSTFYQRMLKVRSLQMTGIYTPYKPGLGLSAEDCRDIFIAKACQERLNEIRGGPSSVRFFRGFFEPTTRRLRMDYELTQLFHNDRNQVF